jgi:outer membrane lipoprotein-sorting protein
MIPNRSIPARRAPDDQSSSTGHRLQDQGAVTLCHAPATTLSGRRWVPWLAVATGLILWHGVAHGQTTNSVSLEEMNRAMSGAKSVFTHFVQERHLALFQEPLRSEGYLCFEQPGRIRWEVTEPYKSILVSDGSGVAQFEWVDSQWKKIDIGLAAAMQQVVSQIAGVMKGQYTHENREYSVALANPETGPLITLTPRNEKMRKMMQAIEVHIAPDLKATRRVVLRENGGDFTDIRFDQQVVNAAFQERTFDRKTPLDLKSVEQAALQTNK